MRHFCENHEWIALMRVSQLQKFLSGLLGRQFGEMDQRCRTLREVCLLESGGRGNSAPHLSIQEGALIVMAMTSRRVTDAFEVTHRLMFDCELLRHFHYAEKIQDFPEGFTIGDLIISVMRGERDDVEAVEMSERGQFAWASIKGQSENLRFQTMNSVAADAEADWAMLQERDKLEFGHRFYVSGNRLQQLGKMIEPNEPDHLRGVRKDRVIAAPGLEDADDAFSAKATANG
jgi:hypothetical protein